MLALLAVAQADAQVAYWDAKYTYWTERPITADPELDVLFPTPPFPSYPSAHSTALQRGGVVLAQLFPEDAADLLALAAEAAASRAGPASTTRSMTMPARCWGGRSALCGDIARQGSGPSSSCDAMGRCRLVPRLMTAS